MEIGVWHGVNTRNLRQVMALDGILYAIDPFRLDDSEEVGTARSLSVKLQHQEMERFCFLEQFSHQAIGTFLSLEKVRN